MEVNNKIIGFIETHFHSTIKIDAETDLFGERIIDSIGIVELISFLHEEFKVSIPFESISMSDFKNIDSLSTYVQGLKS